ncbi:transmembrane protease serine 9-like [Anomaloglossus baeobatrachus]|uniref:transmembrane protease serine 9-like n=1 Tax=Anomaloglossus baeobatrachus TaxID=238106 RepID=UPI003F50C659
MELKILGALIFLHLAVLSPADGRSVCGSPQVPGRIVGGTDAVPGEWPWQVSLMYLVEGYYYHICGGSLISPQWVLTAAHCFDVYSNYTNYLVSLGAYKLLTSESHVIDKYVSRIIIYPRYSKETMMGDIALMKLSNPVTYTKYIMPVCLPAASATFNSGQESWTTGWGNIKSEVSLPSPMTLQKVMVPLIDYRTCDKMYHVNSAVSSNTPIIYNTMICAGYSKGGKDSCQGDSGGPLVSQVNGIWYQAGVVSWGIGCALADRPGVYTLVTSYQSWIWSYVPELSFHDVRSIPQLPLKCSGNMNVSCYLLILLIITAAVLRYHLQLDGLQEVGLLVESLPVEHLLVVGLPVDGLLVDGLLVDDLLVEGLQVVDLLVVDRPVEGLQEVQKQVMSQKCSLPSAKLFAVTDYVQLIHSSPLNGCSIGLCFRPLDGDDGSPLVCNVQRVWYQVGIVSHGVGCGTPYRPVVFSLVTQYQSWIQQYLPYVSFTTVTNIPKPDRDCVDFSFGTSSGCRAECVDMTSNVHPSTIRRVPEPRDHEMNGLFTAEDKAQKHIINNPLIFSKESSRAAVSHLLVPTTTSSKNIDPTASSRIVGGADADDGEWPWQVSVQYEGFHICGGTLISDQWVMSAAHCFEWGTNPSNVTIVLGMYQLYKPSSHEIFSTVNQIIIYPEYNGFMSKGDIALVKLSAPVIYTPYIQAIRLPDETSNFPCGLDCWTTGWGQTNTGLLPDNGTLQEVVVPLIDHVTCDELYHVWSPQYAGTILIHDYEICAGYIDGQKDSCQGDSGGPLMCKVQGAWYQAGIVSWGDGCGGPYRPGIYSLVSIYRWWIQQYVPNLKFTKLTNIKPDRECLSFISSPASSQLWAGYRTGLLMAVTGMFCALWSAPLAMYSPRCHFQS